MITVQYPNPIPRIRGDTFMLWLPLVHVDDTGAVTGPLSEADAQAFGERWSVRRLQIKADIDDPEPEVDIPGEQIQVVPTTSKGPGIYVEADASDTRNLDGEYVWDLELQEVRSGRANLEWTIASGQFTFLKDVTRYEPPAP